jgi:Polysaccharide deacetylase
MRWLLVLALVAGCGDNLYRDLPYFEWNGQRTIGAFEIDALAPDDPHMAAEIATAKPGNWVVLFYGHNPGPGAPFATIESILSQAHDQGLPMYTFADLVAGTADGPGICLSFDDTEVDQWILLRPMLAQYGAHISFFVTEYQTFTADQRAELHTLYADGNSIEAHGVHHANELTYVAANGLDALIADEVKPSIDILVADGFTPKAFAHPGGAHSREIDDAILTVIPLARSISGAPKD